jgi:hypothetical protein
MSSDDEAPMESPRRVPLAPAPEVDNADRGDMEPQLWTGLVDTVQQESIDYRAKGKLTALPTAAASPRRAASEEATALIEAPPAAPKKYLVPLRALFDGLGESGVGPHDHRGLFLLHAAAEAQSIGPIYWSAATPLQTRIAERRRVMAGDSQARTARGKELLDEQTKASSPPRSSDEVLRVQDESRKMDAMQDQLNLELIDRRAAAAEQREGRAEAAKAERGAELKAKLLQEREARRLQREAESRKLLEEEEDGHDTIFAAERVRERWNAAKKKVDETGDVTGIDDY